MEVNRSSGIRPSPIFYLVLAVTVLGGYLCWNQNLGPISVSPGVAIFIFVTAGWILSLIFHEFAHAYVAWKGGDKSVAAKGYLTLNPLKYAHPVLSLGIPVVILFIGGIGLPGGAVWIDRSKLSPERESGVSIAGPTANLIFALLCLIPIALTSLPTEISIATMFGTKIYLALGLAFLGAVQIISVVINMLPVPGLDGYGVLEPTLSEDMKKSIAPFRNYGFFILFFLIFSTPVGVWLWIPVEEIFKLFGIDFELVAQGFSCYSFWSTEANSVCDVIESTQQAS